METLNTYSVRLLRETVSFLRVDWGCIWLRNHVTVVLRFSMSRNIFALKQATLHLIEGADLVENWAKVLVTPGNTDYATNV